MRISGPSGSFGVTRYQWPRIIAANTPPVATGAGPAGAAPFGVLVGQWALFVWLRLIVGLVFPLIVSWAAVQTARSRSMESATGLLYINVGSIAAGTILAAGLYFGAGVLV